MGAQVCGAGATPGWFREELEPRWSLGVGRERGAGVIKFISWCKWDSQEIALTAGCVWDGVGCSQTRVGGGEHGCDRGGGLSGRAEDGEEGLHLTPPGQSVSFLPGIVQV